MGKTKATVATKQEPVAPVVSEVKEVKPKKTKQEPDVPVLPVDTVVDTNEIVEDEETISDVTAKFIARLQEANALLSSLKNDFKNIEKRWTKELKVAQKSSSKKKKKSTNRQPSGFVKPTKISDELALFLEKEIGSEMARTQVTREINNYIRAHNLQDSVNGRHINPDEKLAALLKIPEGENLTYFNLQRYMSPHFFKNVKPV
jgi:upstream activation factor subunit UAF30